MESSTVSLLKLLVVVLCVRLRICYNTRVCAALASSRLNRFRLPLGCSGVAVLRSIILELDDDAIGRFGREKVSIVSSRGNCERVLAIFIKRGSIGLRLGVFLCFHYVCQC